MIPGLRVNHPVGVAGVPPQVQVVAAPAGAALQPAKNSVAVATSVEPTFARNLIYTVLLSRLKC